MNHEELDNSTNNSINNGANSANGAEDELIIRPELFVKPVMRSLIIPITIVALLSIILLISSQPASAAVKTLGSITTTNPSIALEFSDPITITDMVIYYKPTLSDTEEELSLSDLGTSLSTVASSTTDHKNYVLTLANLKTGYYRIIISKEPYGDWTTGDLVDDQLLFVVISGAYSDFKAEITAPRILYHASGGIGELWDTKRPIEVILETDNEGICYYESSGSYFRFDNTGGTIHETNFSTSKETSFKCEYSGADGEDVITTTNQLSIGYIDQPLKFNISFDYDYIMDLTVRENRVRVIDSNNGPLFCYYTLSINGRESADNHYFSGDDDSIIENYLETPSTNISLDINERSSFQNYTVTVTCEDKSGRFATLSKSFYLNYTESLSLKLVSPTINEGSVLNITVGVEGTEGSFISLINSHCVLSGDGTDFLSDDQVIGDDNDLLHTIIIDDLDDGDYDIKVVCQANDEELSKTFSFTIDTEPPAKPNITTSKAICSDELEVSINCDGDGGDDDYCDDLFFEYALYKGSSEDEDALVEKKNSSDDSFTFDLSDEELSEGDNFLVVVTAFDLSKNPSDPAYKSLSVEDPKSTLCDHTPPSINVTQTQLSSGAIEVSVICEDEPGGSGCSDTFDYSLLAPGVYTCTYTNTSSINDPLLVTESSKLCLAVSDLNDNTAYHTENIIVSNFSVDHCSNGKKDFELGETDVDCGGVCDPCTVGLGCEENYDCSSGTCVNNLCSTPSCDDGVLNGNETGVDCGGPDCDPCSEGANCDNDSDCESGTTCVYGVCTLTGNNFENNSSSNKTGNEWWSLPENNSEGEGGSEDIPSEPTVEEGTNWWALSLIIIGLLMVAGGGFWAYYEYELKNGIDIIDKLKGGSGIVRGGSLNSGFPPGLNTQRTTGNNLMSSGNKPHYSRRTKSPSSSSSSFSRAKQQGVGIHYHDAAHKIEERLKSKRESLLGAFDTGDDDKEDKAVGAKGSSGRPAKGGAEESSTNSSKEGSDKGSDKKGPSDDGFDFIDIRDLGSKNKKHTKELTDELNKEDDDLPDHLKNKIKKKKKLKKIDDTFKELDELLK